MVSLGDLRPRSAEEWLRLVWRVEQALIGQMRLFDEEDKEIEEIVKRIKAREEEEIPEKVEVNPLKIETEEHRSFGTEFVVKYFWDLLDFEGILKRRVDVEGKTLVFDRGIATPKNMEWLKAEGKYKWVVASCYWEGKEWLREIEGGGWKEVELRGKVAGVREPKVKIKGYESGEERLVIVFSEGRKEKERSIRKRGWRKA